MYYRSKDSGKVLSHGEWQNILKCSFHPDRPPAVLEPYQPPAPQPVLPELSTFKSQAQQELVHLFERQADSIAGHYPWFERDTWQQQEAEALAYQAWDDAGSTGTAPDTPTLTGIATVRGITLPELVTRVIANATAWRQAAPALAGQRQAAADQIAAADTYEVVEQVLEQVRAELAA